MAGKTNGHNMETDWARAPPPPGTAWERFCKALYDPQEKSFLGRTPQRWAIVLLFYAIFYAVLAALFTACMAGLFYNIDETKPHFILSSSLIGDNPGVSYRPRPEGFVLLYHSSNISETHPIMTQLDDFFEDYKSEPWFSSQTTCVSEDSYGFPDVPCFFIKVNKIYGWEPEYYDVSALPEDMPEDLKSYIGKLPPAKQKQVWVSCWEEKTNLTSIVYPWNRGIDSAFFPYKNMEGYRQAVVPVKITAVANTEITVRCRAWAKNIVYNKSIKEPRGYARIQFKLVDGTAS